MNKNTHFQGLTPFIARTDTIARNLVASTSQSQLPFFQETAQGVLSTDMRQKAMKIS
jgi:hypothetical protein